METPVLDELERMYQRRDISIAIAVGVDLRTWITQELGEEPAEASNHTPEIASFVYRAARSMDKVEHVFSAGGHSYYRVTIEPDLVMIATNVDDYSVYWFKPSDIPKIADERTVLQLLLKEF